MAGDEVMRLGLAAALMLAGCTSAPVVQYKTVTAELPPALLREPPQPDVPVCSTQSCVADYMVDLHAWGEAGWSQVAAISDALAHQK